MTAPAAETPPEFDYEALAQVFASLSRAITETWQQTAEALVPAFVALRRLLGPYLEGAGRCYGPVPLAIDGHAYRRRTRRRRP